MCQPGGETRRTGTSGSPWQGSGARHTTGGHHPTTIAVHRLHKPSPSAIYPQGHHSGNQQILHRMQSDLETFAANCPAEGFITVHTNSITRRARYSGGIKYRPSSPNLAIRIDHTEIVEIFGGTCEDFDNSADFSLTPSTLDIYPYIPDVTAMRCDPIL